MSFSQIEDLLYRRSGLLGVSGTSADMRTLLSSEKRQTKEAIEQFCVRAAEQIAVMATAMSGIDILVFTGGIGEKSPAIRKNICHRLAWLGLTVDDTRNSQQEQVISKLSSPVEIRVLATDEERVIAGHTIDLIERKSANILPG
jgi:acetate kinase